MDAVAHAQDLSLDDGAAGFLRREILLRQEDHPYSELVLLRAFADGFDMLAEKRMRQLQMNPCTVASLTIRIDRTAMPYVT